MQTRYDPYSNNQTTFHRSDPTGRIFKLHTENDDNSWWTATYIAIGFSIVISLLIFFGIPS